MPDRHVWWKFAVEAGALAQELVEELEFMGRGPGNRAPTGEARTNLLQAIVKANETRAAIVAAIHNDRGF
jgi:hypothetical protein